MSDFEKFAFSGKKLWELHAHFEQVPPLAAKVVGDLTNAGQFKKMRIVEKEEDSFSVEITPSIRLEGLPARALDYTLGSKSALDWVIEKYQITVDSDSQLTSNPLLADMPPGSGALSPS